MLQRSSCLFLRKGITRQSLRDVRQAEKPPATESLLCSLSQHDSLIAVLAMAACCESPWPSSANWPSGHRWPCPLMVAKVPEVFNLAILAQFTVGPVGGPVNLPYIVYFFWNVDV